MKIQIGQSAAELLCEVVAAQPSIEFITLAIYKQTEGFLERIASEAPSLAERLKSVSDKPRWNTTLAKHEQEFVIKERLFHDRSEEFSRRRIVPAKKISKSYFDGIVSGLSPDQAIAVCSICTTKDGDVMHIPMMDFSCEIAPANLDLLILLIRHIGLRGAILESGNSYHFYGFDLIDAKTWMELMAIFLLSAPLSDVRYIAHRILGQTCVLRITANKIKPYVPIVVSVL
jgi:hypothetical protein